MSSDDSYSSSKSVNFGVLLPLVQLHGVEGVTNPRKKAAIWKKIAAEYNDSVGGGAADHKTLARALTNRKTHLRAKESNKKKEIKKTGGGVAKFIDLDTSEEEQMEMDGCESLGKTLRFRCGQSVGDSDDIYHHNPSSQPSGQFAPPSSPPPPPSSPPPPPSANLTPLDPGPPGQSNPNVSTASSQVPRHHSVTSFHARSPSLSSSSSSIGLDIASFTHHSGRGPGKGKGPGLAKGSGRKSNQQPSSQVQSSQASHQPPVQSSHQPTHLTSNSNKTPKSEAAIRLQILHEKLKREQALTLEICKREALKTKKDEIEVELLEQELLMKKIEVKEREMKLKSK